MINTHRTSMLPGLNQQLVGLAYSKAKKILVMNRKGGVGKSTIVISLISKLLNDKRNVAIVDFDKQHSSFSWASEVLPCHFVNTYNPSLKSLSTLGSMIKVPRSADFVVLDSPSNFSHEDMLRFSYFVDVIIIPMAPSPIDLHASLPFIKSIIDSKVLTKRNISLFFLINRCNSSDARVERVNSLLNHFRNYQNLGEISENEEYQLAFVNKRRVNEEVDRQLWTGLLNRLDCL